jgi:bifunctional DNA-binding transcriptional regulator/antitoxin component of YhaV-PrlF toxin-antitoxin module
VIPREARESMGVKAGDSVIVVPSGNGAYLLKKPRNFRKAITGIMKGMYERDYLKKERENWS